MSDIDEVKSRIDIVEFIGRKVKLTKAGRNFKGLCPFHSEKSPSFMVSQERQVFHCFGCGKGGSVLDFVMEYDHVDFREALEDLAEQVGVTLSKYLSQTPDEKRKDLLLEIHHLASEYYHYLLTKHEVGEKARAYLKDRGVSAKIIKTFGLGYSANSWDGVTRFLKKKGYDIKLLEDSGLLIPSERGGYDRFRGRVMFPLRDHRGEVLGFSGRLLDPNAKEVKYINSPETLLYKKSTMVFGLDVTKGEIQKNGGAVVMEGEFDVLSSYQAGVGNVVALKGTALTEGQVALLKRFAPKVIFALDSDFAGDLASRRGIEIAARAGLEIHVAAMPFGKDPDEVARTLPHELKDALKTAQPIYDYYLTSAMKRHDTKTAYGKKHMSDELFPIFAKIENPILQSHYIKKLAELLDVSETVIATSLRTIPKRELLAETQKETEKENLSPEEKQELYLLALLLQGNPEEQFEELEEELRIAVIRTPGVKTILTLLKEHLVSPPFFLKDFITSLPSELMPTVDIALLWDLGVIVDDVEVFTREWFLVLREIKKRYLKEEVQRLSRDLKRAGEENSTALQNQLNDLASQLRLLEKVTSI